MSEDRIKATVGAIEVMRCMCGRHTCSYCGETIPAHPGMDQHICAHCGYPIHSKCLNTDEKANA